MARDEILTVLRREADRLQSRGVRHLALFGSQARGDARPDSDIDVLMDFDPDARITLLDLARFERELSEALSRRVQITTAPVRRPRLRENIERDAIYAF